MRAVANCVTSHSWRFGAQMPTRLPRRRPSARRPAASSSDRRLRSYQDKRTPSASKIAASREPCRPTVLSSSCGIVRKRNGSSVAPDTYESVPCGFSRSAGQPSIQLERNGFADTPHPASEVAPVAELLEGVRRAVDRRLVVVRGDKLHADRQAG